MALTAAESKTRITKPESEAINQMFSARKPNGPNGLNGVRNPNAKTVCFDAVVSVPILVSFSESTSNYIAQRLMSRYEWKFLRENEFQVVDVKNRLSRDNCGCLVYQIESTELSGSGMLEIDTGNVNYGMRVFARGIVAEAGDIFSDVAVVAVTHAGLKCAIGPTAPSGKPCAIASVSHTSLESCTCNDNTTKEFVYYVARTQDTSAMFICHADGTTIQTGDSVTLEITRGICTASSEARARLLV